MYSSRSFKLSCMDGQVEYPGVQGNVGQTLSCPNEKDCEPSHATIEVAFLPGPYSATRTLISNRAIGPRRRFQEFASIWTAKQMAE